MTIHSDGRQCLLQMLDKIRPQFRAFPEKPFRQCFIQPAGLLEPLHQLAHDMLRIRCRTAVACNEELAARLVAGRDDLVGTVDLIPLPGEDGIIQLY